MKSLRLLLHILFLTVLPTVNADAQTEMIVMRYSTDNGMPSNTVYCTMKDHDGFIWTGSWYGLCSFNGTSFNPYTKRRNNNSDIPPRKVINIVEDRANNLWMRTTENRFYRFDKTHGSFHDMYAELEKASPNLRVIKVQTIDNGNVLIYTRNKNIYEVYTDKNGLSHIELIHNSEKDIDPATMKLRHNVAGENAKYVFWLGPNYETQIAVKGKRLTGKKLLGILQHKTEPTCFAKSWQRIHIGTSDGSIITVDLSNGKVQQQQLPQRQKVTAIAAKGYDIYATTDNAIFHNGRKAASIQTKAESAFIAKDGMLWLYGLQGGLTMFNPKTHAVRNWPTPQKATLDAAKFCDAGKNGLFILLRNGKIWKYDRKTSSIGELNVNKEKSQNQLSFALNAAKDAAKPSFYDMDLDKEGILWLSSITDGLYKIRFPQYNVSLLFPTLLKDDVGYNDNNYGVRALYQASDGDIWIGTRQQNLYCVDGKTGKTKRKFGSEMGIVYHIMKDRHGNYWFSSKGGGLIKGTPDKNSSQGLRLTFYRHNNADRFSLSSDKVYYSYEDSNGRIWVCTYGGGLNMIDNKGGKVRFINRNNLLKNYPANDLYMSVRQVVEDNNHTMWVATTDGILAFDTKEIDPKRISFNNFRKEGNKEVVDNDIFCILKDSKGTVWLSVFGNGLNKITDYDRNTGRLTTETLADNGLQGTIVSALVEDQRHRIWFTTENGIACIAQNGSQVLSYGYLDGFINSDIEDNATVCMNNGKVLIGSRQGIVMFNPNEVENIGKRRYKTFIVDFKVQNRSLSSFDPPITDIAPTYAKTITLSHDQNMFSIEFAALKFCGNLNTAFTYILDGYENQWHTGDNSKVASYANVPPGHYTFRVRSIDGNSPECILHITVLPPWWATWWAYLIYILLIGAAITGAVRIILSMVRMRNEIYINNRLAELKIRFFTNISHELRTPLTLIKAPVEALKRGEKLSREGKEYIRLIDRNASKMLHLINQILDFRKVQNGKMPLHLTNTYLNGIAAIYREEYSLAAKERGISLNFTMPDRIMAWCDAEKIGIILNNLINNAFKYTYHGGHIDVVLKENPAEHTAIIRVEDNGASIPEEQLENIFERFSMASNTTAGDSQHAGTGIGLSLAREFVQMHHGKIWAENLSTGGVAFTIEIPTQREAFNEDKTEIYFDDNTTDALTSKLCSTGSEMADDNHNDVEHNNERTSPDVDERPLIVLVEDNSDLRSMLTMQLRNKFSVVDAEDGVEGIEKIKACHPDLIITDLMMPRMDGVELIKRVRKDFSVSHVPIIVLTAKNSDTDKLHAIANGANAFITKPFSHDMLMARIEQLLKEQSVFQRKIVLMKDQQHDNDASDGQYEQHLAKNDLDFVERIKGIIDEHLDDKSFNVDTLAESAGLSRSAFFKKLKSLTGFAPADLVKEIRLGKARHLVVTTDKSAQEIAFAVGFKESSYFGKCFKKKYGMTPLEYRQTKRNGNE